MGHLVGQMVPRNLAAPRFPLGDEAITLETEHHQNKYRHSKKGGLGPLTPLVPLHRPLSHLIRHALPHLFRPITQLGLTTHHRLKDVMDVRGPLEVFLPRWVPRTSPC